MPHPQVYVALKRYQKMQPGDTVLSRSGGISPAMIRQHRGGALPVPFINKLVERGILELVTDESESDPKLSLEEQVAAEVAEAVASEA